MEKFEDTFTNLMDLKENDKFLTKSNNIGTYLGQIEDGKHLLQHEDGSQYIVPHGNFTIFKQVKSVKYDNNFKKKDYIIKSIDKSVAYEFIRVYHYLGDAKFFSKFAYGLYLKDTDNLLGVTTFSNPQGISALKGWFSLENTDQTVLELSRLCVLPHLNGTNATSFLLGTSVKLLKKEDVRAVITLADDSRHAGSIYQVCNFNYYGLSDRKTDFFTSDGKVNPRGTTKGVQGVWLPRTQKHRYAFILDKTLICNFEPQPYPKKDNIKEYTCCNNTNIVHDNRFNVNYSCPKCTDKIEVM